MIELALFMSYFIASIMGFIIAHYVVIPIIEYYFLKKENEFLIKIKKENEEIKKYLRE